MSFGRLGVFNVFCVCVCVFVTYGISNLTMSLSRCSLTIKSKSICIHLMVSIDRILQKFIRQQHVYQNSKQKKYQQKQRM